MLGLGLYMTKILPKDAPNHLQVYELHKSFGVMVLILVLIRITNRLMKGAPPLQETISKIERILAYLGHFGLYVLMIITPLSGYLMSNSFGFPVKFFGIKLPFLVSQNFDHGKIFALAHELLAYALLALVVIHILAVIKHRYFDKPENDVLKRML
jgi:cytochrome b561